jgi:hypothetical protein
MKNINEKAMLVRLSISSWGARKFDRQATGTVETTYNAPDAGRFNKLLISSDAIKAVSKTANAARTWHYENTLPWSDEGSRLLPSANFLKYSEKMRELKADFDAAVRLFVDRYHSLIQDAQHRLGQLFNLNDYPTDIERKFNFEFNLSPMPVAADFRVNLQAEELEKIRADIEARADRSVQEAHADLYRRLTDTVKHMADKLADSDAIFRDSLIGNVCELCDLIPRLNVVEDEKLEEIRQTVFAKLCQIDPQTLRDEPDTRKETAKAATDILDALGSIYGA